MRTLLVTLAAAALTGCSGFTIGAVCYLPAGAVGACEMQTMPASPRATVAPAPAKAASA